MTLVSSFTSIEAQHLDRQVLKQLANLPEDEGSKDQAGPECVLSRLCIYTWNYIGICVLQEDMLMQPFVSKGN